MPIEYLTHTSDIKILVSGEKLEGLFKEALRAMAEILSGRDLHTANYKLRSEKKIEIKSDDITTLLIDFLNEVLSASYIDKILYYSIEEIHIEENSIEALVIGTPIKEFAEEIKSVTYHEANVEKDGNLYKTTIIFDI